MNGNKVLGSNITKKAYKNAKILLTLFKSNPNPGTDTPSFYTKFGSDISNTVLLMNGSEERGCTTVVFPF